MPSALGSTGPWRLDPGNVARMTGLEMGVGQEAAAMRGLTKLTKVLKAIIRPFGPSDCNSR
jgi:hypothetical protein